jgi:Icc-related predicted phosphoesterase
MATSESIRIAAVGDLHCPKTPEAALHALFAEVGRAADVLLLLGDLTDYGRPDEGRILAKQLKALNIPILAVLGNHDLESGAEKELSQIIGDVGVTMIDGETCEVHGIAFVGTKGFAGGFGDRALQPWGEEIIKRMVHEAVEESLKLESALARVRTTQKVVVLLHYSPIRETVEGEPLEIMPFLGSSRLEEPLNRYPVTAVFHGHAHHGSPEGRTKENVPVYNVAMPMLRHVFPDRQPFRIVEIARPESQPSDALVEPRSP